MEDKLKLIEARLNNIEDKLDLIIRYIEKDVKKNCSKMGEHIDFIEKIYDNVKNPLGYLCHKLNYFSNNDKQYPLELNENENK